MVKRCRVKVGESFTSFPSPYRVNIAKENTSTAVVHGSALSASVAPRERSITSGGVYAAVQSTSKGWGGRSVRVTQMKGKTITDSLTEAELTGS
jgi:hypothetical protein